MAYDKQRFENGSILMAEQLNAMDDQIAANEESLKNLQDSLPKITTADEGKVLVVKDGKLVFVTLETSGGGGPSARIADAVLLASAWVGTQSPYSQVVQIEGVTANSQVDLTPSVEQLSVFYNKDLSFVTENEGGVVTVYAIGQKPTNDYTIQVTITEVA